MEEEYAEIRSTIGTGGTEYTQYFCSVTYFVGLDVRPEGAAQGSASAKHPEAILFYDCSVQNGSWCRDILKLLSYEGLPKHRYWRRWVEAVYIG